MNANDKHNPVDASTAALTDAMTKHLEALLLAKKARQVVNTQSGDLEKLRSDLHIMRTKAALEGFRRGFFFGALPFAAIGGCAAMLIRAMLQ